MSWTEVVGDSKAYNERCDEELFGAPFRHSFSADNLEDWLKRSFWSFSARAPYLPLPYSQGTFVLCGVDPLESTHSDEQGYNWTLLPDTLQSYGFDRLPAAKDAFQLDQPLLEDLATCAGLNLSGPQIPLTAIERARKRGFEIPWYDFAKELSFIESSPASQGPGYNVRKSPSCSEATSKKARPPAECDDNIKPLTGLGQEALDELPATGSQQGRVKIRKSPSYSEAASKKAHLKWESDDNTKMRKGLGQQILDELTAADFRQCRGKNGKVQYSKIAKQVRQKYEEFVGNNIDIPAEKTIIKDIKQYFDTNSIIITDL